MRQRPDLSVAITAGLILLAGSTLDAQPRWSWPDRAENLQVLPADFPGERLRAVMTGFTRALGVQCSYCHVGEEGQPLSTFDFPSDDNPNKGRARVMLNLLGAVNEHLDEIEPSGPDRVNVWCHTCHAGRPKPATLQEHLWDVYRADGADAVVAEYGQLRERYYGRGAYDFSENGLNGLGYQILRADDAPGAVAVFRLNVEQFPASANAYDSLAEAYMEGEEHDLAIIFYRKSLELDPENENARQRLRELAEAGQDRS